MTDTADDGPEAEAPRPDDGWIEVRGKAAAPAPNLLGRGGLTDEEVLMPLWQPAV